MKKRAVIVERTAHRRLRIVDSLRHSHSVEAVEILDGLVRTVRSVRPELVLIGVGRRIQVSTRVAHQIKTDGANPPIVALMDWDGRLTDPAQVARNALVDGIFLGSPNPDSLQQFVSDLETHDDVVVVGEAKLNLWKRLFSR